MIPKKDITLLLINDLIVRIEKITAKFIETNMKKLFILTIFIFTIACKNTINVAETYEAQSNPASKSWNFYIAKEEFSAPKVFIQPYQRVTVDCSEQPCDAYFAGKIVPTKYNGKNFTIDITTSDVYSENTTRVDDHQYIEVRLANDAYVEKHIARLTVSPLSDLQTQTIKQQAEDEQWSSNVKLFSAIGAFIAVAIIVAFVVGFQLLKLKVREEDAELRRKQAERNRAAQKKAEREAKEKEAKDNVTPEDILNHVNG